MKILSHQEGISVNEEMDLDQKAKNQVPPGKSSELGSPFDYILCRNVLIYFSRETIRTLMEKIHRHLKDGGYLFIGHSESIPGCNDLFKTVSPSVFQKI